MFHTKSSTQFLTPAINVASLPLSVDAAKALLSTRSRHSSELSSSELSSFLLARSRELSPLHWAVARKDVASIKHYLGSTAVDGDAFPSPLVIAAACGHHIIAKILLENGASVNGPRNYFQTPLYYAVKGRYTKVVRVLLAHGADTKEKWEGCSLLHFDITESPESVPIAKLLIEHGADVNKRHPDGYTPLDYALGCRNQALVDFLRANGGREAKKYTPGWIT